MLEAGLAQELTTLFSKDELLEMYLNLLNYGHLAYGPEAASQVYFWQARGRADPGRGHAAGRHPAAAGQPGPVQELRRGVRQRVVLDMMVRHGKLSPARTHVVYAQPIALNPQPDRRIVARSFWCSTWPAQALLGEQPLPRAAGRSPPPWTCPCRRWPRSG